MVKVFAPLIIQPPASRRAVVRVPPASEPASGSVSDQQPSFSPRASGTTYFMPLRFGAEFVDVVGAKRIVRGHDQPHRAIDARQLLDGDDVLDVAQAGAAVLLREDDAQQAQLGELGNQFRRETRGFVPLHDVRSDFRFGEFADGAAKLLLFVGQ